MIEVAAGLVLSAVMLGLVMAPLVAEEWEFRSELERRREALEAFERRMEDER